MGDLLILTTSMELLYSKDVQIAPTESGAGTHLSLKRGGVLFFSKGIKKKAPDAGTKCPLVGLAGLSSPRHWCQLQAANKQLCVALKPNSYHQGND